VLLNPAERVAAVRPMWEQRPHSLRVELLTVDLDTLRQQAKAQADKQRATAGAHSRGASSVGPRTAGWDGAGVQQCRWVKQRAAAAAVSMLQFRAALSRVAAAAAAAVLTRQHMSYAHRVWDACAWPAFAAAVRAASVVVVTAG
jgi:hypothetical protein